MNGPTCSAKSSQDKKKPPPSRGGDVTVYVKDMNQPSLPIPFYSVPASVSVFRALSSLFHSMHFPDNSPFSHSVVLVLSLPCRYFRLYFSLWKSLSPWAHLHVVGMLRFRSVTSTKLKVVYKCMTANTSAIWRAIKILK